MPLQGVGHPVSRELLALLAKNSEADMDLDFAEHTGPGEPQVALCYLRCEEGVGRPEALAISWILCTVDGFHV